MKFAKNILETIGNTPLVRLNKITADVPGLVLAKVESFNPGNSVKDRMALKMVQDAEADGRLQPGGTIVEGTSGNTGMGLALATIVKGYKLICVSTDKQSKEKLMYYAQWVQRWLFVQLMLLQKIHVPTILLQNA